jgi:hypothetical protein
VFSNTIQNLPCGPDANRQILLLLTQIIMEHSGVLFDRDEAKHNVAALNYH